MSTKFKIDDKLLSALTGKVKTEDDLNELSRQLLKMTIEKALNTDLDEHLGYDKHSIDGNNTGNSRNGSSPKYLKGEIGTIHIDSPRDRNSTFEPSIVSKGQSRLGRLDKNILHLYAKGMTTRDISDTLMDMYDTDVSHSLISKVTTAMILIDFTSVIICCEINFLGMVRQIGSHLHR